MSPVAADCAFSNCCIWSKTCSPLTPCIYPGREYTSMPVDADDSPTRSVLLGIMATSEGDRSLRLDRFRVARSGRVLGRSDDVLEALGGGYYKPETPHSHIRAATAVGSPDGRYLELCFFNREADFSVHKVTRVDTPTPLQLRMDLGAADDDKGISITVSSQPGLPPEVGRLMPTCPISAAGDLWAPYLTDVYGPTSLVMQRFDKDAGEWVKVETLVFKRPPHSADMESDAIPALHGHVVVGDTILLSFWPFHHFYTFNCSTHAWAAVATNWRDGMFIPIRERGVYVEEDDTIYLLGDAIVYAYKLRKDQDRYQMAPPTYVGRLCPFSHEGYGFLSYLGGRIFCSVWIGVKLPCSSCDAKHVLITTFRVKGDDSEHFVPKGLKVLHSTFRRLDMAPSKSLSYIEFNFLQEYEEFNHESATPPAKRRRGDAMESSMLLEDRETPASSNVFKSSNMLACCREALNEMPLLSTTMLERSAIQTNRTFYVICQVASHSTVYKINILDGRLMCHDKTLTPHCILETPMAMGDFEDGILNRLCRPWHFVCDRRFIYAAPSSVENKGYSCCLDQGNINHIDSTWPVGVKFHLVVRVGIMVVAISDTLQDVYHLFEGEWTCHKTSGPPGLDEEVNLSGYVVLSSCTFIVSDARENRCFLHDIGNHKWSIVVPVPERKVLPSGWPIRACLSDRCVFAKGFIYTCSYGGLSAFELVEQGGSYYLGKLVHLEFSWMNNWERNRMCLEYVGEDTSSGAIMFCVMTDDNVRFPCPMNEKPVRITTVQVKTEEMPDGKLKPKSIGHVDIGTTFVESNGGAIWTRDCFAAA